jgi:hypothetical protein
MTTLDSIGTRTTLSNLAREIHLDIIARLPYDARASLRRANSYFHSLIPPFSHKDLLVAEREEYAAARDLFTCKYCLCLLHKSEFGDNMTKKKRARGHSETYNRFCVRCGLHPPHGCGAYCCGNLVKWGGQEFAVMFCVQCRKMELWILGECRHCRKTRIDILRKQEEQERRVERKAEREAWHRRAKEFWGSDTSSGGEFDDLDSNPDASWDNEST